YEDAAGHFTGHHLSFLTVACSPAPVYNLSSANQIDAAPRFSTAWVKNDRVVPATDSSQRYEDYRPKCHCNYGGSRHEKTTGGSRVRCPGRAPGVGDRGLADILARRHRRGPGKGKEDRRRLLAARDIGKRHGGAGAQRAALQGQGGPHYWR